MVEIDTLLMETPDHPPCGVNLEYQGQFLSLIQAARGKPEQQIGQNIVPGEQPDWKSVRQQAEALLAKSKDLRIALLLIRALIHIDNLIGLRDGLRLLSKMIARYWEHLHPVPDPHDPEDGVTRFNILAQLTDLDGILKDVRGAMVVVAGPHGRVSVRDILLAAGSMRPAAGETIPNQAQIQAAVTAAAAQDQEGMDAAAECVSAIDAISSALSEKTGAENATDLRPLSGMLKVVAQACHAGSAASSGVADTPTPAADIAGGAAAGRAPLQPAIPPEIRTRDDAMRMLDAVCRFYEQTEPGNPAPLLIQRAQRLINKNFVEIMQDLVPDSVEQIRLIAGLKK